MPNDIIINRRRLGVHNDTEPTTYRRGFVYSISGDNLIFQRRNNMSIEY